MTGSTDPYVYPGTTVLKNLPELREADALATFEAQATANRIRKLIRKPLQGKFDVAHLRAIHRYIFQDVFAWAGEIRSVSISKGGFLFASPQFIVAALEPQLQKLRTESLLRGLTVDAFATRCAYYFGEVNAVHPFREGNGRTQREFFRELALEAGHTLRWRRVERDEMITASSVSSTRGDNSHLARLIRACMD
ncbi:MAG TPA: Fic family protein [Bryobacteraceae bacterium]|jgi:cell filamentation protein|nr:Fic family protein [Bryobacteraceae bacterium]